MIERFLQVGTFVSSIAIVAGLYMVHLQLEEQEKARIANDLNVQLQIIDSALIGIETFHEVNARIENYNELSLGDKKRIELVYERIVSWAETKGVDDAARNELVCINFNHETGRRYLEWEARRSPAMFKPWLDALNAGCEERFEPNAF